MSNSLQDLTAKATSDPTFRSRAKQDPRAALGSLGIQVPAGVKLHVYENGPSTVHVILPEKSEASSLPALTPGVMEVFERAWTDPAFKAELLRDPKRTIQAATSAMMPSGLTIFAHENTPTDFSFVLPYLPPASGELRDADLEMIAGGKLSAKDSCAVAGGVENAVAIGGAIASGGTFGAGFVVAAGAGVAGAITGLVSSLK